MYQFIETILAEEGVIKALSIHQQRLDTTIKDHGSKSIIDLEKELKPIKIPKDPKTKIRVTYDLNAILNIDINSYTIKQCKSFKCVDIGSRDYHYKFADRAWIYALLEEAGTDEIIMTKNGMITDASIANLAFFNGKEWHTPKSPLLMGTKRTALLNSGKIESAQISVDKLVDYISFKLINSMINWDEGPVYSIGLILL